jgi:hypothetical protein
MVFHPKAMHQFNAAYDIVKNRIVSGIGIVDMMFEALAQFKISNQNKQFNVQPVGVHCHL